MGSDGSCWSVRSTTAGSTVPGAVHCGPAAPTAITADGRYVLARETVSNGSSRVMVLDASTGVTVLAVTVAEGATVAQTGFRIGLAQLVLSVVAPDGGNRLAGCTLGGRCQSLTSTVAGAPGVSEPYLLVRD